MGVWSYTRGGGAAGSCGFVFIKGVVRKILLSVNYGLRWGAAGRKVFVFRVCRRSLLVATWCCTSMCLALLGVVACGVCVCVCRIVSVLVLLPYRIRFWCSGIVVTVPYRRDSPVGFHHSSTTSIPTPTVGPRVGDLRRICVDGRWVGSSRRFFVWHAYSMGIFSVVGMCVTMCVVIHGAPPGLFVFAGPREKLIVARGKTKW